MHKFYFNKYTLVEILREKIQDLNPQPSYSCFLVAINPSWKYLN